MFEKIPPLNKLVNNIGIDDIWSLDANQMNLIE
jgi:hypothetical protein